MAGIHEATAAAAELGIVLEERPGFLSLVQDMLKPESLPDGWTARYDAEHGRREYTNAETGAIQYTHPMLAYYRGASWMESGGYRKLLKAEQATPPGEDEVNEMCVYLGVDPSEDPYVLEVAHMAVNAPLPEGWTESEDSAGHPMFINTLTGESQGSHPLDAYFVELITRRRAELEARGAAVAIKSALSLKRINTLAQAAIAASAAGSKATSQDGSVATAVGVQGSGKALLTTVAEDEGDTSIRGSNNNTQQSQQAEPLEQQLLQQAEASSQGLSDANDTVAHNTDAQSGQQAAAVGVPAEDGEDSNGPRTDSKARHTEEGSQAAAGDDTVRAEEVSGASEADDRSSGAVALDDDPRSPQGSSGLTQPHHSTLSITATPPAAASRQLTPQPPTQPQPTSSRPSVTPPASSQSSPFTQVDLTSSTSQQHTSQDMPRTSNPTTVADSSALPASVRSSPAQPIVLLPPDLLPPEQPAQPAATQLSQTSQDPQPVQLPQHGMGAVDTEPRVSYTTFKTMLVPPSEAGALVGPPPMQGRWLDDAAKARALNITPGKAGRSQLMQQQQQEQYWQAWQQQQWMQQQQAWMQQQQQQQLQEQEPAKMVAGEQQTAQPGAAEVAGQLQPQLSSLRQQPDSTSQLQGNGTQTAATTHSNAPARMQARVRVAIRARPLVDAQNDITAWVMDEESRSLRLKDHLAGNVRGAGGPRRTFHADLIVPVGSPTESLFVQHVQPVLEEALQGVNAAVMAYGQTGSGKTYTMFGEDNQGLRSGTIGMSVGHLFSRLTQLPRQHPSGAPSFTVKLSMLELYNEQLRDLLVATAGVQSTPLQLVDDPQLGIRVQGLAEVVVDNYDRAIELIASGNAARAVGSTALNENSTRSHTIVRLVLDIADVPVAAGEEDQADVGSPVRQQGRKGRRTAVLHFVDLAGSERLARTGSTGIRFTEGTNINLSLLMLGSVVASLASGRRPEQFIPYRNSKLTRLLQPCLGGNARTVIVAAINPSQTHVEETVNTLLFAQRAMNMVNTVTANIVQTSSGNGAAAPGAASTAVAELRAQVAALQAKLRDTEAQLRTAQGSTDSAPLTDNQRGALALALEELANDKAVLLDRLEALTGVPQGGPWDGLPPTPPGLNLPRPRPPRRVLGAASAGTWGTTPERAVRSILRIVNLGQIEVGPERFAALARPVNASGKQGSGNSVAALDHPEAAVAAVRRMRTERDELRKRDARLRGQLTIAKERLKSLEPFIAQQDAVDECCQMLEDLMGPTPNFQHARKPHHQHRKGAKGKGKDSVQEEPDAHTVDRLREGVEAVVLLSSELSSLQRQLHTSIAIQKAAERRAAQLEELLRHVNERSSISMISSPVAQVHAPPKARIAPLQSPRADQPPGSLTVSVPEPPEAPAQVTSPVLSPTRKKGFFSSLFGGADAPCSSTAFSPGLAASTGGGLAPPKTAARLEDPKVLASKVRDLQHLVQDQEAQMTALKDELAVVKGELEQWRGFTDAQEIVDSPKGEAARAAGDGTAGQRAGGQVVVIGSMAVRAAREARARAAALERALEASERERVAAKQALLQLEAASGLAPTTLDSQADQTMDAESGEALQPSRQDSASDTPADGEQAASARFEHLRTHVLSLTREVAALTKERDTLLAMVLHVAAQQPGPSTDTGQPQQLPLSMPTGLLDRVFLAADPASNQLPVDFSLESVLSPALQAPAPARQPASVGWPGLRGRQAGRGGRQGLFKDRSMSVPVLRGHGGAVVLAPLPVKSDRPAFDASPVPIALKSKLLKEGDRLNREFSQGVGGAVSDSALNTATVGSLREADLLTYKRKLVALEKARREAETRVHQEAQAAQAQVAAVTRQAAAAANAHAAQVQQLEAQAVSELMRVKSEASSAITALMQENSRLKALLADGGQVAPTTSTLPPPALKGRSSLAVASM